MVVGQLRKGMLSCCAALAFGLFTLSPKVVDDASLGDRPKPAPKAAIGHIKTEFSNLLRERAEDLLRHILRVDALQSPALAPVIDHRPVDLHRIAPRLRLMRLQAFNQRHRR